MLLYAVLHDRYYKHRHVVVVAVALEAWNVEALVACLSDECLLAIDCLSVDVEVVEVLVPGVFP